jgi:hypothetical protein
MRQVLSNHPKYVVRFWQIIAISCLRRFRILVVGRVRSYTAQPNPVQIDLIHNAERLGEILAHQYRLQSEHTGLYSF